MTQMVTEILHRLCHPLSTLPSLVLSSVLSSPQCLLGTLTPHVSPVEHPSSENPLDVSGTLRCRRGYKCTGPSRLEKTGLQTGTDL